MASFIEKLRMNNIFGGGGILPQLNIPTYSSGDPMEEVISRYSSMIPQTSGIQDIGGRISGAPEQMQTRFIPPPSEMITPFQEASLALRERGLEGQEERAGESTRLREEQLEINKKRAEIYDFTSKNPNARIIQRDGNLIAINPRTGEDIRDLGSSRFLSDEDRLKFQQEGRLEIGEKRSEQQTELERLRQENRELLEKQRQAGRLEVKKTPTTQSELDKERATINRVNELLSRKPEYRDYIETDPNTGVPRVKEPGQIGGLPGGIFGRTGTQLTPEIAKEINDIIFGTGTTTMTPEVKTKTPETKIPEITKPIPGRPGWVGVSKDNGKTWTAKQVR